MKLIAIACSAIVSLIPFVDASAAAAEFRSQTVSFADLDLAHPQGLAALWRRVQIAAEAVCEYPNSRMLMKEHKDCVHRATVNAVNSINRPEFSAHVAAHGGPIVAEQLTSR